MRKPKCVLCGNEIDEKNENFDFIGSSDDVNSYYISSNKKLIGKEICENEFEDPNGAITLYRNGKSISFDFQDKVVRNTEAYDSSGFDTNEEELKEICDIANSYSWVIIDGWRGYYDGKRNIGNLTRVVSSYTGRDYTKDLNELEDFIENKWEKKVYVVTAKSSNLFNTGIDIYVEKEDKKEFIDGVKKNVLDTSEFDFD